MIALIKPRPLQGTLCAPPSKSEAHRLLLCASLSDAPTRILLRERSEDIDASMRCLVSLGARFVQEDVWLFVTPIQSPPTSCDLDCGESGSTLRFMLPLAAALGVQARFILRGRLPERPIEALEKVLCRNGCLITHEPSGTIHLRGKLMPGKYVIPGDVSSQFISALLMALPLLNKPSNIEITGQRVSAPYIAMTLSALQSFGVTIRTQDQGYALDVPEGYHSPRELIVHGDWSNAAFWLCANALPICDLRVTGLDMHSVQGDRRILRELELLTGASAMHTIDAMGIPDLIPALCACACALGKDVLIINAAQLRSKESDRIHAIARTLTALGARISEQADGLIVRSGSKLHGGQVSAFGDHRIAMMLAIAACACKEEVRLHGAECVRKSYPRFWEDYAALGGCVEWEDEV